MSEAQILLKTEDMNILMNPDEQKQKITEFLEFLYKNADVPPETDYFEVRVLYYTQKPSTRFFALNQIDKAADYIVNINKKHIDTIKGIYVTVNITNLGSRSTEDSDIIRVLNLVFDVDIHDKILTEDEYDTIQNAVIEAVKETFPNTEFMVTRSGFGFQVFIKTVPVEPAELGDKTVYKKAYDYIANKLRDTIIKHLDDDELAAVIDIDKSVYNYSRIMRVAYTVNNRYINDTLYRRLSKIVYKEKGEQLNLVELVTNVLDKINTENDTIVVEQGRGYALDSETKRKVVDAVLPYYLPGARHYLTLGLSAWLYYRGVSKEDTLDIVKHLIEKSGDKEEKDRIIAVDSTYDPNKPNRAYNEFFKRVAETYLKKELMIMQPSEDEIESIKQEIISRIKFAMSEYLERVVRNRRTQIQESDGAAISIRKVLNDEYGVDQYILEHVIDAVKETDELEGGGKLVLKLVENNTIITITFDVNKHYKAGWKAFEWMIANYNFEGLQLVDEEALFDLDKKERKVFEKKVALQMSRALRELSKVARVSFTSDIDDARDDFITMIEEYVRGIVKIPSREDVPATAVAKLLRMGYMIYDERANKVYYAQSLHKLVDDSTSFAKKLGKFFYFTKMTSDSKINKSRTMFHAGTEGGREVKEPAIVLDAEKFFEFYETDVLVKKDILDYADAVRELNILDDNKDGGEAE